MPYQETVQHKQFTRRALVIGAGQVGLLGALGARLYHLQVVEQDRYQLLAEENRINLRLIAPPRGRVLDRFRRGAGEQPAQLPPAAGGRGGRRSRRGDRQGGPAGAAGGAADRARPARDPAPPQVRAGRGGEQPGLGRFRADQRERPGPARHPHGGGRDPGLSAGPGLRPCGRLCRRGVGKGDRRRPGAGAAGLPHRQDRDRAGCTTWPCAAAPATARSRSMPMAG